MGLDEVVVRGEGRVLRGLKTERCDFFLNPSRRDAELKSIKQSIHFSTHAIGERTILSILSVHEKKSSMQIFIKLFYWATMDEGVN